MMNKRSTQCEWLDFGPDHTTLKEYADCLRKLGHIGTFLGGDSATMWAFDTLKVPPKSILDVGCGGGFFTLKLAKKYPHTKVVGIDIAKEAIEFAKENKEHYEKKYQIALPNLFFEHRSNPRLEEPSKSYDVVTATLLCHHLTDEELIQFLQSARQIASHAIILNDLQRSRFAYLLYWIISPLFWNDMIRHDGLLSIKRSFTRKEWHLLLDKSKMVTEDWSVTWKKGFRLIVKGIL